MRGGELRDDGPPHPAVGRNPVNQNHRAAAALFQIGDFMTIDVGMTFSYIRAHGSLCPVFCVALVKTFERVSFQEHFSSQHLKETSEVATIHLRQRHKPYLYAIFTQFSFHWPKPAFV